MLLLEKLGIPSSCVVDSIIYKKYFYENVSLSSADKDQFTKQIKKIRWLACLKFETINIPPYKDDIWDYPEIEVLEVFLNKDVRTKRIAEIIMRAIPYPMILVFYLEDRLQIWTAHQRINLSDRAKNTIEEFVFTDWLEFDSDFFQYLNLKKMSKKNCYAFYNDIVDTISIYNAKSKVRKLELGITGKQARCITKHIEQLEQEIIHLRAQLNKESQFNRKIELNIKIKKLETDLNSLIEGGYNFERNKTNRPNS